MNVFSGSPTNTLFRFLWFQPSWRASGSCLRISEGKPVKPLLLRQQVLSAPCGTPVYWSTSSEDASLMPYIKSLELAVKIKVMCRRKVTLEAAVRNQLVGAASGKNTRLWALLRKQTLSCCCVMPGDGPGPSYTSVACLNLLAELGSSVVCFLEAGIDLHSASIWGL